MQIAIQASLEIRENYRKKIIFQERGKEAFKIAVPKNEILVMNISVEVMDPLSLVKLN